MLLITLKELLVPSRKMTRNDFLYDFNYEAFISFATNLNLNDALSKLAKYTGDYNEKYPLHLSYVLISVATIDDISEENRVSLGIDMIEDLSLFKSK